MALPTAYGGDSTTIINNLNTYNGKVQLINELDLGDKGIIKSDLVASVTVAKGDVCYINSSGEAALIDASAASTIDGQLVMANEAVTGATAGEFILWGYVSGFSSMTPGTVYWASTVGTTGNTLTTTKPSTTGEIQRKIGTAMTATEIFFNPSVDYGEVP